MKPVVMGIVIRKKDNFWQILTQLRLVQNKAYDPLYDQTHEVVGETIKFNKETGQPTETIYDALLRGVAEECGKPDFRPVAVYGAGLKNVSLDTKTTGKGDIIVEIEPYSFVMQMGPPQPWIGPVFLVEVPSNWEPDHGQSDGEAGHPKWWHPDELAHAILSNSGQFMGLHMPSLLRAAIELTKHNQKKIAA